MTNSIKEIADADFICVFGSNTTETHPIISLQVKKAVREKGATLVVIDPRQTEISAIANHYLQLKAGTDVVLLNALANVIIAEGLWDKEFVSMRTEGFDELKKAVEPFTSEYAAGITGVPANTIREVARGYAKAKNASILYTMGITQHVTGTDNVLAVANLAMLAGHIGKPSSGVNPLRGQNNVQGACDMGGLPNVYTGYQKVDDPAVQGKFEQAWKGSLPSKPGLTLGEMLDEAHHGKLKGLFILGENPILSDPDYHHVVASLKHVDFLVVQDIFLTETAQLADVVLPGASFAEKDGTFSNTERRVQRVRKAIDPIGNSKADWQIICEIATAMGYRMSYESPAAIMKEIASLTPSYGGITYERLEEGGLQWPCPTADHPGTPYLHVGKFSRGLGKFSALAYRLPAELPDAEYPFLLNTGRRLFHYHTGSMTRRASGLDAICPEEFLEVNPADATKLGVSDGDTVKLVSRRGELEIKVQVTDRVMPGTVFASFHFAEAAINKLTNTDRDPVAKTPELKVCAVKIVKA